LYILHRPIKIEGFTAFVLIMVCILLKKEEAVQWYKIFSESRVCMLLIKLNVTGEMLPFVNLFRHSCYG
jgi:hypothetical protein